MSYIVTVRSMHAAACHYDNISVLTDMEVIISQVVDAAFGHTRRDIHRFALSAGLYIDLQSGLVLHALDLYILGGYSACALTVLTYIVCAFKLAAPVGDDSEQFFCSLVHNHSSSLSFPSGQRAAFSSLSRPPRTSSRLPTFFTVPFAMTAI